MRVPELSFFPGLLCLVNAQSIAEPAGNCHPTCITPTATNDSLSFGQHYAVVNLDLVSVVVEPIANTSAGSAFINNMAHWINAVHSQEPPPLSIFTRVYFSNARKPEIVPGSGLSQITVNEGTINDTNTTLYPAFQPDIAAGDVVLEKTGTYAGAGNAFEQVLRAQKIDTVILSGIRSAGSILNTAYRLYDMQYTTYVPL